MFTRKFFSLAILALLILACSAADPASGPTVEPTVPASGTILLRDEFEDRQGGWDTAYTADGIMDYDSGVYRIVVNTPHLNFWSTPPGSYTDTRVEVDTARFGGPDDNRAGIICRYDGTQHYFFIVSSDGYFGVGILRRREDHSSQVTLLGQDQMLPSGNIKTGMAVNHLRADCAGNTLSFYVNGFLVAQVNDPQLTSGRVGLLAGADEAGGVDVIFDKFIVMQP